eukprot:TRINITY_DN4046_c0_g1_i1.p1 TRINITY_DN4046_c0_g1~~TRINITY_DN4046_c0_g1_i1.p1  ORF type:complete len:252 (-),score=62.25 TRINITY_DN4046_c0_g1_i1:28-783(-)
MSAVQIVKLKVNRNTFEIISQPGKPVLFRRGQLSLPECLESDDIWVNFKKGDRASESDLMTAFETTDPLAIAERIMTDGEIQFTAEERREFLEEKRNQIISYIHKYFMDPRSKRPHPRTRISNALDQLNVRVDPNEKTKVQVKAILKRLPEVLPIKKDTIEGDLTVPHKFLGQIYGIFRDVIQIKNENYTSDGCTYTILLVPGDYDQFMADMTALCKDEFQFNIHGAIEVVEEPTTKRGKNNRGGKKKRNR